MITQTQYKYLEKEKGPKVIVELLKIWGTKELLGDGSNPTILSWAKELGLSKQYNNDEIPWCGLAAGIVIHRAGFELPSKPLWARDWLSFGSIVKTAMLGDILVFSRPGGGGHVGLYLGEDTTTYHVGGGNQSDTTGATRILKTRCIGIRRCPWKIAQPKEVRVIKLGASGPISENES